MKTMGWALFGAVVLAASVAQGSTILLTPSGTSYSITQDSTDGISVPTSAVNVTNTAIGWGSAISGSNWIAPLANQSNGARSSFCCVGTDTYTTTFSLSGFDTLGVTLSLSFLADDYLTVYLNSLSNQIYSSGVGAFYAAPTNTGAISLSSAALNSGTNTLLFVVQSIGGPTGLDITGSVNASPSAVPEPAAFGLMISGLGGLLAFRRFRRS